MADLGSDGLIEQRCHELFEPGETESAANCDMQILLMRQQGEKLAAETVQVGEIHDGSALSSLDEIRHLWHRSLSPPSSAQPQRALPGDRPGKLPAAAVHSVRPVLSLPAFPLNGCDCPLVKCGWV